MALCAGLDGRPTFGEVLEECIKLADEQQMRDALKGTGDMTKAEPTAVHATAEYLVEAGCSLPPPALSSAAVTDGDRCAGCPP